MRTYILLFALVAVLLLGCSSNSTTLYLPTFNTAGWNSFYTGGDGSSTDSAIIINTTDSKKIADAENHYLEKTLGSKGITVSVIGKTQYLVEGRVYDLLKVVENRTDVREYHFDVSIPAGNR